MNTTKVKEDIEQIIGNFAWRFNTQDIRNELGSIISKYLEKDIVDYTSIQDVDINKLNFRVKIDEDTYPLMNYIEDMVIIERKYKIEKLKAILWEKKKRLKN